MERAKVLLSDRANSITDVALILGYSFTSSFTLALHKITGQTPSEFRKNVTWGANDPSVIPRIGYRCGVGPDLSYRCSGDRKPSVSVCMKLTSASSSASDRPSRPMRCVFIWAVDSGAGQHVVPSPGSLDWQRGRTSRVL